MSYTKELVETVQSRLKELGYYSDVVDGDAGPNTQKATTQFKAAHSFAARPYPGPLTLATLFSDGAKPAPVAAEAEAKIPPWITEMRRVKGLHEKRDNTTLRRWLASDGATLGDPAQFPWCGDAVQTALALTVPGETFPSNPYLAKNWATWGRELGQGSMGAVLSFWRGSPTSTYGHVCFYVGEDATAYHVLGGNQSNAVTVTRIAKNRLRQGGIRWPMNYPMPNGGVVHKAAKGKLSTNEA